MGLLAKPCRRTCSSVAFKRWCIMIDFRPTVVVFGFILIVSTCSVHVLQGVGVAVDHLCYAVSADRICFHRQHILDDRNRTMGGSQSLFFLLLSMRSSAFLVVLSFFHCRMDAVGWIGSRVSPVYLPPPHPKPPADRIATFCNPWAFPCHRFQALSFGVHVVPAFFS